MWGSKAVPRRGPERTKRLLILPARRLQGCAARLSDETRHAPGVAGSLVQPYSNQFEYQLYGDPDIFRGLFDNTLKDIRRASL